MKLFIAIVFFIASYYLISKYLFPYLLNRFIRKTQERFQNFQQGNNPVEQKKEGEVKVDYVPPKAKTNEFNPDSAEDVDFEEIKDN
jgi:hypothetical protein